MGDIKMSVEQAAHKPNKPSSLQFVKLSAVVLIGAILALGNHTGIAGQASPTAIATAAAASPAAETVTNPVSCPPALTRGSGAENAIAAQQNVVEPTAAEPATNPAPAILTTPGCTLMVTLLGISAGPGRPVKGWGTIVFVFDMDKNQICYALHVGGIKLPATAMHIHRSGGQVAMLLPAPAQATADSCVPADPGLMKEILDRPGYFWVNIHNADYPTGAIRGWMKGAILLKGAEEVPPGDPKGWGAATFAFDGDKGKVCYEVNVSNVTLPGTVTHIHVGKPGTAGPAAIVLAPPNLRGYANACADADPALLKSLMDDPSGYYINVHNADFPKSALRGQFPKVTSLALCPPALTVGAVAQTAAAQQNAPASTAETAEAPAGPPPVILNSEGCTVATTLVATVRGPAGAPTPWGSALFMLNTDKKQICYAMHVRGIKLPATSAEIYRSGGQTVVALTAPAQGTVDGCVEADPALIQDIRDKPGNYWVDVRTTDFPRGVVRGRLKGAILLKGAGEVPPGDPKGWGWVALNLDPDKGKVCYEAAVTNIALPGTVGHIHKGEEGVAGPTVTVLAPPDVRGYVNACADADPTLIRDILDNPTGYYVNIHNADFPKSALRGQLPPH
jgi:hypothetical protein